MYGNWRCPTPIMSKCDNNPIFASIRKGFSGAANLSQEFQNSPRHVCTISMVRGIFFKRSSLFVQKQIVPQDQNHFDGALYQEFHHWFGILLWWDHHDRTWISIRGKTRLKMTLRIGFPFRYIFKMYLSVTRNINGEKEHWRKYLHPIS